MQNEKIEEESKESQPVVQTSLLGVGPEEQTTDEDGPAELPSFDILLTNDMESLLPPPEVPPIEDFREIELEAEVLSAIGQMGWLKPTLAQSRCLPYSIKGKDVAGFAQTGTGKTGVFLITLAQKLFRKPDQVSDKSSSVKAVVLCPTRELTVQIEEEANKLFSSLNISTIAVFGGTGFEQQAKAITDGVDLIVATPGRLKDFFQRGIVDLGSVDTFICDEVDRMFEMGFLEEVEFFLGKIPAKAQKLVFSATTNERVKELAFEYLTAPEYLFINADEVAPESIEQHVILCETPQKFNILLSLLRQHKPHRAIIFSNTKLVASWLHYKLSHNGVKCELITGDLPQTKRMRLIKDVKAGNVQVLIATDVASRGLHISEVSHVYNFDLPDDPANYIHRIGRTARAGANGASYSLACEEYAENYAKIQNLLGDVTPKAEWPDEEWLKIEDRSGNPFLMQQEREYQERNEKRYMDRAPYQRPSRPSEDGKSQKMVLNFAKKTDQASVKSPSQAPKMVITPPSKASAAKRSDSSPSVLQLLKRIFALLFGWAYRPKKKKMVIIRKDSKHHTANSGKQQKSQSLRNPGRSPRDQHHAEKSSVQQKEARYNHEQKRNRDRSHKNHPRDSKRV